MTALIAPQIVTQNIARAKSLFNRDQPVRALDALILGLDMYDPSKLFGKARFEVEVLLIECVQELNRQPKIRTLLQELSGSSAAQVCYSPGQEETLRRVLPILRKALIEIADKQQQAQVAEQTARRLSLEEKGLEYLQNNDLPRAKATLRRLADEFGSSPGVLSFIGEKLMGKKLEHEAVEFFEQAIGEFPRESKAYSLAAKCYLELHEFEKAEIIYLTALKEFGRHSITLVNLAKLYLAWNKKDKAFEMAQAALALDSSNADAQAIFASLT